MNVTPTMAAVLKCAQTPPPPSPAPATPATPLPVTDVLVMVSVRMTTHQAMVAMASCNDMLSMMGICFMYR